MTKEEEFVVAQKALIKDEDKYLILKRSPTAPVYANYWDFPGGKLEVGENVHEALEREVMEETSLKSKSGNPIFCFHETLEKTDKTKRHVLFIVYECDITPGEIKISWEHTDYKWATKDEILSLDIENFLREFLEKR